MSNNYCINESPGTSEVTQFCLVSPDCPHAPAAPGTLEGPIKKECGSGDVFLNSKNPEEIKAISIKDDLDLPELMGYAYRTHGMTYSPEQNSEYYTDALKKGIFPRQYSWQLLPATTANILGVVSGGKIYEMQPTGTVSRWSFGAKNKHTNQMNQAWNLVCKSGCDEESASHGLASLSADSDV
jgi:hypothetical protein